MTQYNVHLYREMRLDFGGIEADTPEAAAAIASEKPTREADAIEDCEGENLAALIDVAGDEEYEHSVTIDFEPERQRRAAPKLLTACQMVVDRWERGDLAEAARACSDAIAEAEKAGISPAPPTPRLLDALQAVLPYAEAERASLQQCWERDDDARVKEELDACDRALEQATAAVAEATAVGIPPLSAPAEKPARFDFTHEPEEDADRAYVLVDGSFDVKIVRTAEGIVIDVYWKDGINVVGTMAVWDEDVAEPEQDAAEGA